MIIQKGKSLSPCNNNCRIDRKTNYCVGCYRNMREITNWVFFDDKEKMAILKEVEKRRRINQSVEI